MICYGQYEPINQHTAVGRYLLFVIFKKLISIPAIQICNIFNEVTVATRPIAAPRQDRFATSRDECLLAACIG